MSVGTIEMKLNKAVGKSLTSTSIAPVVPILSSFTLFTPGILFTISTLQILGIKYSILALSLFKVTSIDRACPLSLTIIISVFSFMITISVIPQSKSVGNIINNCSNIGFLMPLKLIVLLC